MTDIPITFEFQGKQYTGHFSQVTGCGSNANFHLSVTTRHWGQLFYIEGQPGFDGGIHAVPSGWRFSGNIPGLEELTEYFGYHIIAWLDGNPS
jgi:hypothetical protein